jgi:hypothetical protein
VSTISGNFSIIMLIIFVMGKFQNHERRLTEIVAKFENLGV